MSGNSGAFLKYLRALNIDYKTTTHLIETLVNILITSFSSPNPWLHWYLFPELFPSDSFLLILKFFQTLIPEKQTERVKKFWEDSDTTTKYLNRNIFQGLQG
jgi:hypothetical protein